MKQFLGFKIRKIIYLPILFLLLFVCLISIFSNDIEIHYVYKILPAVIIYTDNIEEENEAITKGLFILINPRSRSCKDVLDHELVHVKQCYRYGFYHWIVMMFDNGIAKFESEAYATGITNKQSIPHWAEFIKKEYKLSTPKEKIEEYLTYYWKKIRR
jgi:hypothetical protein